MKLGLQILAVNLVVMILIVSLDSYILHKKKVELYKNDIVNDAYVVKQTLVPILQRFWSNNNNADFSSLLDNGGTSRVSVKWEWVQKAGRVVDLNSLKVVKTGEILNNSSDTAAFFVSQIPVVLDGENSGFLIVEESLGPLKIFAKASKQRTLIISALFIGLGLVISSIFGFLLIGKPVKLLQLKSNLIAQGNLDAQKIKITGRTELSSLANSLNKMQDKLVHNRMELEKNHRERISMLTQLRHTDRLKTVGGLASGVAHELGTPLNVILGRATLIASAALQRKDVIESAEIIVGESKRMTGIIEELLNFARRKPSQQRFFELSDVVGHTINLLAPMLKKKKIDLRIDFPDFSTVVMGDENQLQQVVTNLVVNAIDASFEGGEILVSFEEKQYQPKDSVTEAEECIVLEIRDYGSGMDEETKRQIFDPFFTTKDVGQGTGLGLSIVHGIVTENNGWIDVSSAPKNGSIFSVYFPKGVDG